jgi:hypothetical protein
VPKYAAWIDEMYLTVAPRVEFGRPKFYALITRGQVEATKVLPPFVQVLDIKNHHKVALDPVVRIILQEEPTTIFPQDRERVVFLIYVKSDFEIKSFRRLKIYH